MANGRRKNKKAKEMAEKKLREEEKKSLEGKTEKESEPKKETEVKTREEKKNADHEAKMAMVTRYKCIITTLAALCFVFIAGIFYNWYSSGGHIFDDDVVYFDEVEDVWHMFNGRYMRMKIDSAFKWYDGVKTDEESGELVMSGDKASCLVWLDSGNFMSITIGNKQDFEKLNYIIGLSEGYIDVLDESGGKQTYSSNTYELDSQYFEGLIKRPDTVALDKMKSAYSELVHEWGFEDSDYYLYELTLDTTASNGPVNITTIVYAVLAVAFFIASIVAGVKYHKYKKVNGIKIVRE